MGATQSSGGGGVARVSEVKSFPIPPKNQSNEDGQKNPTLQGKKLETPIFMNDDTEASGARTGNSSSAFPTPTGHEYDLMDKIASELPSVIDEQSKQQVRDYMEACRGGKGPMVACFASAEFLSLFERNHKKAFGLYENTCFRPKSDKSPNGVLVDGTKAYPPACFNLAQMLMTGKGGVEFNRSKAYKIFDRACRGGHGGACHLQAKMLLSEPGQLGKGIPYNPRKAADLLQGVCDNHDDAFSCFLLATMLLRGDHVTADATNVTPQEAQGVVAVEQRPLEENRAKLAADARIALKRDPKRAHELLLKSCMSHSHAPSCYNLAVMYTQGDDGIPADPAKAKEFQQKTEEMVSKFGGFGM